MTKRATISNIPGWLHAGVEDYQRKHDLQSWSQAAIVLMLEGLLAVGYHDPKQGYIGGSKEAEAELYAEYEAADVDVSFGEWLIQKVTPRWGGPRKISDRDTQDLVVRNDYRGVLSAMKCRSQKAGLEFCVSEELLVFCSEYWGHRCAACGENPASRKVSKLIFDHWIPLSHSDSPGSTPDNIILLCTRCNKKKNNMLPAEWLKVYHPGADGEKILIRAETYFEFVRSRF